MASTKKLGVVGKRAQTASTRTQIGSWKDESEAAGRKWVAANKKSDPSKDEVAAVALAEQNDLDVASVLEGIRAGRDKA